MPNYNILNTGKRNMLKNFLGKRHMKILVLCFSRKQLLDTESELQVLVRRLGSDVSGLQDSDSGTLDRLTVPLLKKEGKKRFHLRKFCCLHVVIIRFRFSSFRNGND